jgi:hypothetical protein
MSIKSKIWSYKWWLVIGTVFSLIYIGAFIYVLTFNIWEHQWANDLRLIIILFFGGILGEIINKSKDIIYSFVAWISIGIYQGILFYFVYWIVFQFIINQELVKPSPESPLLFPIITTFGLAIFSFIPANIVGGFIVFIGRHFIREKKSDND